MTMSNHERWVEAVTFPAVFSAALSVFVQQPRIGLTARQMELVRFIRGYQLAHGGVSPSYADMATGMRMKSRGQVAQMLDACEERGWLRRIPTFARAIELLVEVTVPHAPDGAPVYFVPVKAVPHDAPIVTGTCCTASSGMIEKISNEVAQ